MADTSNEEFLYRFDLPKCTNSWEVPWDCKEHPEYKKKLATEVANGLYIKGPGGVLGKVTKADYFGFKIGDCGCCHRPTNEWVALTEEQYQKELSKKQAQEEQEKLKRKDSVLTSFDLNKVHISCVRGNRFKQEDLKIAWRGINGNKEVEACSPIPQNSVVLFEENNLLARAVHKAFYEHFPLRLTPDSIWITIAQGFAAHVNENSEKLRSKFVSFEGKKDIVIERPEFVKGSPNNDWVGVFPEFTSKIESYIGAETVNTIQSDFSTTTIVERTVSQIVLMDSVKSYFEYVMVCGCGIPYIELTGTVDDWEKIKKKASALREFDLEWWIDALIPILDEFILAAKGQPNIEFWTSICNLVGGSGIRQPISGWIQAFFPYLMSGVCNSRWPGKKEDTKTKYRNEYILEYQKCMQNKAQDQLEYGMGTGPGCGKGVPLKNIPSGISKVPFKYVDLNNGQSYDMLFCGGLTTLTQDDYNGTLEPKVGWAVLNV